MTRFGFEIVRDKVKRGIDDHGLRPFARELGVPVGVLRSINDGREIGVSNLIDLCDRLGVSLSFGQKDINKNWLSFSDQQKLPHHGIAKCGLHGWGKDQPDRPPLPMPELVDDPDAFYVSTQGQSMIPEGIDRISYCLVSPAQDVSENDRVWIRDKDGATSIKRLVGIKEKSILLRGWLPIKDGKQQSFDDERMLSGIDKVFPVIAVYKGKPGGPDNVEYIPDPKSAIPSIHTTLNEGEFSLIRLHDVQASAGVGRVNWNDTPISALAFPIEWLRQKGINPERSSLIYIEGNSMEPTLTSGSMVMINRNRNTPEQRRIYAFLLGGELFVKRLEIMPNNMLLIHSDNADHKTRVLQGGDLDQFNVIGEIVWSGHDVSAGR